MAADTVGLPVCPGDSDSVLQDVCDKVESMLCVGERVTVAESDKVETF